MYVCVRVGKHQQRISVIFGIGPARCHDTCTYCNRHFGLISSPSEWTCRREAREASKATGWLFVRSTTSYPLPSTIPRFQTTCHCLYFPFLLYWANASLSYTINYANFWRNKQNQPSPRRPRRHPWLLTPISRWPHSMYVSFFSRSYTPSLIQENLSIFIVWNLTHRFANSNQRLVAFRSLVSFGGLALLSLLCLYPIS